MLTVTSSAQGMIRHALQIFQQLRSDYLLEPQEKICVHPILKLCHSIAMAKVVASKQKRQVDCSEEGYTIRRRSQEFPPPRVYLLHRN
mmetsp:Transcript_58086/g.92302  ORF Transcript_58086/g.92302 Transcript_58086/m.92302 type:complete len:88 (-) Transcript_58086:903-1166(-)